MVRGFEKGSNPLDAGLSSMWRSLGKKNPLGASAIKGKAGVTSSPLNAKASKAKEAFLAIFSGQHRMSKTHSSNNFIKEMMDGDSPECPYDYVPDKEFLPDFALECNKRLAYT